MDNKDYSSFDDGLIKANTANPNMPVKAFVPPKPVIADKVDNLLLAKGEVLQADFHYATCYVGAKSKKRLSKAKTVVDYNLIVTNRRIINKGKQKGSVNSTSYEEIPLNEVKTVNVSYFDQKFFPLKWVILALLVFIMGIFIVSSSIVAGILVMLTGAAIAILAFVFNKKEVAISMSLETGGVSTNIMYIAKNTMTAPKSQNSKTKKEGKRRSFIGLLILIVINVLGFYYISNSGEYRPQPQRIMYLLILTFFDLAVITSYIKSKKATKSGKSGTRAKNGLGMIYVINEEIAKEMLSGIGTIILNNKQEKE